VGVTHLLWFTYSDQCLQTDDRNIGFEYSDEMTEFKRPELSERILLDYSRRAERRCPVLKPCVCVLRAPWAWLWLILMVMADASSI
jgi:hypothetical protein